MYDFGDKVVLITGGTRGIGAALARAMAGEGARLCVVGRDGDAAQKTANGICREFGTEAFGRACDVRDSHRVTSVVDEVMRRFGRIDVVINNAAMLGKLAPLHEYDPSVWTAVIDTNLNGTFYVARLAAQKMLEKGGGRIVFVTSSVGREVRDQWGAYCVSKWAIEGLMKLMACENKNTGVVVCSINPGGAATEMRRQAFPHEDQSQLSSPEAVAGAFLEILRQPDARINGRAFNAREHL